MAQLAADNLIGFLVHGKALTPLNPQRCVGLMRLAWAICAQPGRHGPVEQSGRWRWMLAGVWASLRAALLILRACGWPRTTAARAAEPLSAAQLQSCQQRRAAGARAAPRDRRVVARQPPGTGAEPGHLSADPGAAGRRGHAHAKHADRCLWPATRPAAKDPVTTRLTNQLVRPERVQRPAHERDP